ncbi:protoporphyrinogen oxidase [Paenibacillus piri]|uniref:Coproporphyrinogen III oxidase n=1 Tax=Paenibacillus piri TaxID=2547395 RepID=A0A4V2ZTM1_9BACL|nr:protoporphyrinogen oxidase [Paenibacillus piri]TDF97624.1 protoporphyrinogen oxidase [Paenibacillus piri]
MGNEPKHVAIIGGGLTGLSAAYYLKKAMAERGAAVRITLIEKGSSFGGRIHTLRKEGFVIEKGPDSFLARKPAMIELTRELGLEDQLTGTNPNAKKTYIIHKNRFHRMPPGLVLGIPTELGPFMKTGLLSIAGKARAALDLLLPKRSSEDDESLGAFLERRLGKEVLSQIAEPLLAGIYAGNTYALSVKATFPQFHSLEQKHRSLIIGMTRNRKQGGEESRTMPEVAKNTVFLTFKQGLQTIVEGLTEALVRDGVRFIKEAEVRSIRKADGAGEGRPYELTYGSGQTESIDGAVIALPAYAIAPLLQEVPAAHELMDIDYASVANVILAFREQDMVRELDGSGLLVPRSEGRFITACTWTSSKWLHTAPEGKVLLRCYVGRSGDERWMGMSEPEIVRAVRHDLQELMGITAEPMFTEITKMPRSMPQYPVGHLQLVQRVRSGLAKQMPGVHVTGAAFHGVGLPDCVRQGKETALALAAQLTAAGSSQ